MELAAGRLTPPTQDALWIRQYDVIVSYHVENNPWSWETSASAAHGPVTLVSIQN